MQDCVVASLGIPQGKLLTIVIPVRASRDRTEVIERLGFSRFDDRWPQEVGVLVVDDGSDEQMVELVRSTCDAHGFGYLRLDTMFAEFSVGRCRNYGAMYATSPFVLFQDVDLMPVPGFYAEVVREVEIQGLHDNVRDFLMFPYVFLTECATREFLQTPPVLRRQKFLQYAIATMPQKIEKISTGTSANLYNREYFLARGGNDPDFQGWGFEDLEFNTRCLRLARRFPLPRDWSIDRGNFATVTEYSGWKSAYRLFGDQTFLKGIAYFHAWHPVNQRTSYMQRRKHNERLFNQKLREFARTQAEPDPLPSMVEGRTLLFRTNPFVFHREIQPKLGQVFLANEESFTNDAAFIDYLQQNRIDRVMFHNPYVSERMIRLYRICRKRRIPLLVSERGALPNSLFFDRSGFLADSRSYRPKLWNKPLSRANLEAVKEYIMNERQAAEALEAQSERLGAHRARENLKLKSHQKVLFVALQRPSDAATRFFAGPGGGYEAFIEMLRGLAARLPTDWVLAIKRHPLEDEAPAIEGALAAHHLNVKDLLELSEAVITFNSGTGVLAMIWERPVMVFGRAFYAHPCINRQVRGHEDVLACIAEGFRPDREKLLRFLSYLINEFYSFGTFTTRQVKLPCGSNMTATLDIEFQIIRGLGVGESRYQARPQPLISWHSILYDRYRAAESAWRAATQQGKTPHAMPRQGTQAAPPPTAEPALPVVSNVVPLHRSEEPAFRRKMRKLLRDPERFFADMRLLRRA